MVREDFEPPPDAALLSGSILRQLPVLLLFAAAPFERTYIYGGEVARWVQALGLLMELLGLWLALGARIQLGFFSSTPESGGPRALVRNGLYGTIRHPIWLGEFLVVFAWALEFGAPISAALDDHIRGGDGLDARRDGRGRDAGAVRRRLRALSSGDRVLHPRHLVERVNFSPDSPPRNAVGDRSNDN